MSTFRPVGQWPLVLCGPILRRVSPDSVSVFVALSKPATVTLSIFNENEPGISIGGGMSGIAPTVPLGQRLHVIVVTARFPDPLDPFALRAGQLYSYDLDFSMIGGQATASSDLRSEHLLAGEFPLGYEVNRLPGFALPPGLDRLRFVHGSCRKAGGQSHDMLPLVDSLIARTRTDAHQRPHHLLLTGDQIYADDVPACLLVTLGATAAALLGWTSPERITSAAGDLEPDDRRLAPGFVREVTPVVPTPPVLRQSYGDFKTRLEFMCSQTDFTSGEMDAHLIFLGEFYAQYLMAWSPELWWRDSLPPDNQRHEDLATDADLGTLWLPEITAAKRAKNAQSYLAAAKHTREIALEFGRGMAKVRRALANVPTYMIFDDHDVTDDWNLHRQWQASVTANPTGRQIVRNALIAYAVFQDWGNQPQQYLDDLGRKLLDAIRYDETAGRPPIQADSGMLDEVLNLTGAAVDVAKRLTWDHVVRGTQHQILLMDTRTWRGFPATNWTGGAALIEASALDRQFDASRLDDDLLTFVVSAAPVFGVEPVDALQDVDVVLEGALKPDRERWSHNDDALSALLHKLVLFERVVLLSGDVHYGFAKEIEFTRRRSGAADTKTRVAQFCCSSMKNETAGTRILNRLLPDRKTGTRLPSFTVRKELGERLERHFEQAIAAATSPLDTEDYVAHLHATLLDIKMKNHLGQAITISENLGPAYGTALAIIDQYGATASGSWRYDVSDVANMLSTKVLDPQSLAPTSSITAVLRGAFRPYDQFYVVGYNNLGVVTVRLDQGEAAGATQTLYWYQPALVGSDLLASLELSATLRVP